ncbi:MAG: hypothetical protein IAF58_00335 [Leptolyngbya sp.]|nr:hypothetical protein [Candidatus Melainabacteria bacterium]
MDEPVDSHEPKVKAEPEKGGSGGFGNRKTAVGTEDNEGPKFIGFAKEEAKRLGHNFVGTEQLLIALIRCQSGIAAEILSEFGFTVDKTREDVERAIGRGTGFIAVEIPFTSRAKRVLELSFSEARLRGDDYVGSAHILIGIAREGGGLAAKLLSDAGVDNDHLIERIYQKLRE